MFALLNKLFSKLWTKEGALIALLVCLIVFICYKFYNKYTAKQIADDASGAPIVQGDEGASKEGMVGSGGAGGSGGGAGGGSGRTRVYFDLAVGELEVGRVVMEMFEDKVPKTCENFVGLCAGKKDEKSGRVFKPYMGTVFHRVIPNFMIQGGDYENGDGTGGECIWGGKFNDENFDGGEHVGAGVLSMANAGANTNGSQFFITLGDTPHLNGKHVVFGRVVEGLDIVHKLGSIRTDDNDRPLQDVMIIDCGRV